MGDAVELINAWYFYGLVVQAFSFLWYCLFWLYQVAKEICAQVSAFKMLNGEIPVFVDGHQHVHILPGNPVSCHVSHCFVRNHVWKIFFWHTESFSYETDNLDFP